MLSYDYDIINKTKGKLYDQQISILKSQYSDRISKKIIEINYGYSLSKIRTEILTEYNKHVSLDMFPGDMVLLHGGLFERKSKQMIVCDFSGSIINKGDLYINYRPLIENLTTGNCYVLSRNIKVELSYGYYLPQNIQQLEFLQQSMMIEEKNQEIDYNHLHKYYDGGFKLKKLKRR